MKVMVEMEPLKVSQKILNEIGMMAVDRKLMEQLQRLHPELMRYDAHNDAYVSWPKESK